MKKLMLIRHGQIDCYGKLSQTSTTQLLEIISKFKENLQKNTIIIAASDRLCIQTANFLKKSLDLNNEVIIDELLKESVQPNADEIYQLYLSQYKNETIVVVTHIGLFSSFYCYLNKIKKAKELVCNLKYLCIS